MRIFCFPFAGGNPHIFLDWTKYLTVRCEAGIIQLPGRGNLLFETPCRRIGPLIEDLSKAIEPLTDKPFAFFGHSMGAIVAFELAARQRRKLKPLPKMLFVSGCVAPHIYVKERPLHQLPDGDLIEELKRLGGTPSELLENAELMELVLPALRADCEMLYFYRYQPDEPFKFPIAAFGGDEDDNVGPLQLEAWRAQTSGDFSLKIFSGDHFFLLSQTLPLLETINEKLSVFSKENISTQKFSCPNK